MILRTFHLALGEERRKDTAMNFNQKKGLASIEDCPLTQLKIEREKKRLGMKQLGGRD